MVSKNRLCAIVPSRFGPACGHPHRQQAETTMHHVILMPGYSPEVPSFSAPREW